MHQPGAPRRGLRVALCVAVAACVGVPVLASPLEPAGRGAAGPLAAPFRVPRHPSPEPSAPRRPGAQPRPATNPGSSSRPGWKRKLDRLTRGRNMGVAVRFDGEAIYGHRDGRLRRPASNEKLLLSMALLDSLGPHARISTTAAARRVQSGVVKGDLWILGRGDPTVAGGRRYGRRLGLRPTTLGRIAKRIAAAGIERIRGRIMGSKGYFAHDWSAPGWRPYYRSLYIALPSALSFNGNVAGGRFIRDPERRLAEALTHRLQDAGIAVSGRPGAGRPPRRLPDALARVRSAPLSKLLRYTNRTSSNFFAEVLGKRLGAERLGPAGTIAKGARVLRRWAGGRGIKIAAHDSSGLSHANRISARGLSRLLSRSSNAPWGGVLRRSLAAPGQGTLEDRLRGVRLRAKTGTLIGVSALSGWVWLERRDGWAEFSILSSGLAKSRAVSVEDAIVRLLAKRAA